MSETESHTQFSKCVESQLDALIKANDYAKSNSDNSNVTERIEQFNQHLKEGRDILLKQKLPGAYSRLERFMLDKNYEEAMKEVGRIVQLISKFLESVVIEGAEKFKVNDHLRKHGIIESAPEKIMLRVKEEIKEIGKDLEESIKKKEIEAAKTEVLKDITGSKAREI